jgi:hypothetical protein
MTTDIATTSLSNNAFNVGGFEFTTTELKAPSEDMSFEEWQKLGEFIRLTNQASQWWWGDWMNMGEDTFGEKASQALEITQWDEETLRQYAWVCRKVPAVSRITGVSFSHYTMLAKLPEAEQVKWAERSVGEQLSKRQLRQAIKEDTSGVDEMQPCVLIRCRKEKDAEEVAVWATESGYEIERVERRALPMP